MMKQEAIGLRAASFALFLCLFWGGLTPGLKIALEGVPPIAVAGWRFLLGLIVIWLWAVAKRVTLKLPRSLYPENLRQLCRHSLEHVPTVCSSPCSSVSSR